jgi:hypothetical protein
LFAPEHLPFAHAESGGQQIWPTCPHAQSQPFDVMPSQLPKFVWHVEKVHEPELHATPFAFCTCVVQFVPHEPQCVSDVFTFVSQPELLPPLQCAKPAAHVHEQLLPEHFGVPLTALHAVPHAPQFSGSVVVSRQSPPQHDLPAAQVLPASRSQPSTHSPDGLHFCMLLQSVVVTHCTH